MTRYDIEHQDDNSAFMSSKDYSIQIRKRNRIVSLLEELDSLIGDIEVYDYEIINP